MISKKDLLLELLGQSSAFVQLNGRAAGVILPDRWLSEPSVVLQLGYRLPVPIPDLQIDDEGIQATLSFGRMPFRCVIPWKAVYGLADEEGRKAIFPEDLPGNAAANAPEPPPKPSRPTHLRLVK